MFSRNIRPLGIILGIFFIFLMALPQPTTADSERPLRRLNCGVAGPADLPPDAPVVLILHGTAATGASMLTLCDQLQLPPCRFVLPDGPFRAKGAYAWYDRFTHSRKDIEYSRDCLFEVMDRFCKEPVDSSNPALSTKPRSVIVIGFSQGAVMALEAGLNYKGNVKAIVSLSGYIGEPDQTLAHPKADLKTPIFLMQGVEDPVVQEEMGLSTIKALRKAGYHPFMKKLPMGHKITATEISEVSKFLREVLLLYHS
jgi:phospholipase/carboxylesterase